MIHDVLLRPEAEQDLSDAAGWYEKQRPGMGHEFLDEVLEIFSVIAEAPHMYQSVHRNTRRALIHRFPFGVYYRVEETTIVVVAILHGSRDPRRWKSRT